MPAQKLDIVLYGATGVTGKYVLEEFFKSPHAGRFRFGVAGRNESKLRKALDEVSQLVDRDLTQLPIIVADHSNLSTLSEMAKQARVIINVVGQYSDYGEAVVKAAVENGASHLDLSGEPAWLEEMQLKYSAKARETGAYVVGAAGWVSMPVDMGVHFLKTKFPGCLAYAETFCDLDQPKGYAASAGIFQSILVSMANESRVAKIRNELMPKTLEKYAAPKHPPVWFNRELNSYVMPFSASDHTIVDRTEYYKTVTDKQPLPVAIETYSLRPSLIGCIGTLLHFGTLYLMSKFGPTFRFCQRHPELTSLGLFTEKGPTREQVKKSRFTTYIRGWGWPNTKEPQMGVKPTGRLNVRVDAPDTTYIATSGFVLSAAMTILEDELPVDGGVYTSAVAFEKTKIFDRMNDFGITFKVSDY